MNILLIVIITALLQFFVPWWVIAIVPFLVFLWKPTSLSASFWGSFVAVGAVWLVYGYYLHFISNGAISDRIAQIFFVQYGLLLLLLVSIIAGLVGGFSGLSGYLFRQLGKRSS